MINWVFILYNKELRRSTFSILQQQNTKIIQENHLTFQDGRQEVYILKLISE